MYKWIFATLCATVWLGIVEQAAPYLQHRYLPQVAVSLVYEAAALPAWFCAAILGCKIHLRFSARPRESQRLRSA